MKMLSVVDLFGRIWKSPNLFSVISDSRLFGKIAYDAPYSLCGRLLEHLVYDAPHSLLVLSVGGNCIDLQLCL